jgi:hypothetical protein
LGDSGAILFTATTEPEPVAAAIRDFYVLESRGWKGHAGTAAAFHDEIRRFVTAAVVGLATEGKVTINRILIDGRAIAVTITLRSADTAWFWKIAYDENFAQYSPGVILSYCVTEDLLEDQSVMRTDSCATANHPMIDHIWRERLVLCDRLVAVRPQAAFSLARRLEPLRGVAIAAAKSIRARFHR